jgi:hypothetical protein
MGLTVLKDAVDFREREGVDGGLGVGRPASSSSSVRRYTVIFSNPFVSSGLLISVSSLNFF